EYLLVWTTTPWTLTANVAAAVNPALTYVKAQQGDSVYYLSKGTLKTALHGPFRVLEELPGAALVGWQYTGPFDTLPVAQGLLHKVIAWSDVGEAEGTGIVHIAPSCGKEDYHLWGEQPEQAGERGVPIPSPIDEAGLFVAGFEPFTGMAVGEVAEPI